MWWKMRPVWSAAGDGGPAREFVIPGTTPKIYGAPKDSDVRETNHFSRPSLSAAICRNLESIDYAGLEALQFQ
jgi:hypothetical protein